ncbi:MAG TPA: rhamnan synthesis F family protein [Geothrix sp.]
MRRLIIYAHYDAQDRIRGYAIKNLQALQLLGEVHFVSNAGLSEATLDRVRSLVVATHLRENRGFDFGMWAHVLLALDLEAYDEVLLTNSSIVGPFHPLQPILDRMDTPANDFWGLTGTQMLVPHLQSYFLLFRSRVLRSEAFHRFWASVMPYRSKDALVLAYEIGLTQFLADEGFRWQEAFPRDTLRGGWYKNWMVRGDLGARVRRFVDPTLLYPDLLLESGMPYVKLGLFERNPHRLILRSLLRQAAHLGYDPTSIL